MSQVIGIPTTTAGVAYTLASDSIFLSFAGDTVNSTANNAVVVSGSNNKLTIGGHIFGTNNALVIGDDVADLNNTVDILAGGLLGSNVADGIKITAASTTVNNAGSIAAADDGIAMSTSAVPGTTIINNSGSILAYWYGIYAADQDVVLTNTGTIRSMISMAYAGDLGVDKVINKGLMVGGVDLHTGNDLYDGRLGRVLANSLGGTVKGQDGNDTLMGGKFVDTFDGGTNDDKLTGGLAKDILAGGMGKDQFIFNAVKEAGDTITDFAVVDDTIVIKGSAFGGLAKGVLKAGAFHSNTTGLAHDASDRFIYETDSDRLWYDANGNVSGGRVLLADLNDGAFARSDIFII